MSAALAPIAAPARAGLAFADMVDDFDVVAVATPVESGRALLHPFERAGLGRAPFRALRCEAADGGCAFCGQRLKYLFHVQSGDGKTFVVGSDCVERAGAEVQNFGGLAKNLRREKAAAAKARKAHRAALLAADVFDQWKADNGPLLAFLEDNKAADGFCASLLQWLGKHGALSAGQQGAAERMMVRKAAWAAERAEKRQVEAVAAPVVNIDAIVTAFSRARAAGIKYPKLRIAEFLFKPAKAGGANDGGVYVTQARDTDDEGAYLGKVMGGKFLKVRDCTDAKSAEVVAVCTDPKAAAVAHGKKYGRCSACGRELTDEDSIDAGIGPVCAENYGW